MVILLVSLAAIILLIWIGIILQSVFADFLSYFLLAYLTRFGYSQFNWIGEISEIVSIVVVLWLAYALWKDFGKRKFQIILKTLYH